MCNLKRNDTSELTYKTKKDSQTYKMNSWLWGGVGVPWDSPGIVKDFGKVVYILLYLKWIITQTYCIAHETLLSVTCQAGWEGVLEESGYMCMCGRVPSVFTSNCPNVVNWLYFNTKCFWC